MNNQTSQDQNQLNLFQIIAVAVFATSSFFSLLAYILVLTVLFVYFREFKSNFYYIVISLAAADISYLALILFYVVPCTVLKRHIWAPHDYGAGLLECLAYISQCVHLTFIAFNRLAYASVSTTTPKIMDFIFNNKIVITCWIIFLWALSASIAFPIKLFACDLIYNYEALDFMHECGNKTFDRVVQAKISDAVISGLLPLLVTFLHVLTWLVVYAKDRKTVATIGIDGERHAKIRRREKRILIQFSLISAGLLLFYASFWIIPTFLPGSTGAVVVTLFGIASAGINPFTYLIFNRLMKTKAKYLIFNKLLKRKNNVVSNVHTPQVKDIVQPQNIEIMNSNVRRYFIT